MRGVKRFAVVFIALAGTAMPAVAAPLPYAQIQAALDAVHVIDAVALSPDGRRIAYEDGQVHLAAVGPTPRFARIGACRTCAEGDVAWSPDGTKLVFITTSAAGQGNLAVYDVRERHARVLTDLHGPVSTPRWSPDGSRIAFLYSPGAPKRPSPLQPATPDAGVVGARVYEQRLAVADAASGSVRILGPRDLNVYEYDWSPDGTRFAISAAVGDGDANWWIADLSTMNAASGAVTRVAHPATQIASPRFSGDGTRIATICGIMSDESITGGDVCVTPANGGPTVDVTPGLRASVQTITWNHSSRTILTTAFAAGTTVVADVDADSMTLRERWRGDGTVFANGLDNFAPGDSGLSLTRGGGLSAVIRQSFTTPPEIAIGPVGSWTTVTSLNAHVRRLTGRVRNVTWNDDGTAVQGWLIEPPGPPVAGAVPLVTVVHGGPAFANLSVFPTSGSFVAMLAARGYAVFAPNPRGSYGQGEAFTRANIKDFGGGDLRDILTGLDAVAAVRPIDPKRVGIFGWSYGGFMTMWSITQTDRFKAAVSGAGLSDWLSYYGTNGIDTWMLPYFGASVYDDPAVYAKSQPLNFIKNVTTPTLLLAGDRDAEVPVTQSYEYYHALQELHVPSQFVVYPGEGHLMLKPADRLDVARRIAGWFDRWLR